MQPRLKLLFLFIIPTFRLSACFPQIPKTKVKKKSIRNCGSKARQQKKTLCGFPFFSVKLKLFNQVKCKFKFHFFHPFSPSVFLNNFCGLVYGVYILWLYEEFTFQSPYPLEEWRKNGWKMYWSRSRINKFSNGIRNAEKRM